LQQDRAPNYGAEFARVVDRAVARVQRLHNPVCTAGDALQKVQLEARRETGVYARIEKAVFAQYVRPQGEARRSAVIQLSGNLLQLGPELNGNRRLLEERTDYRTDPAPMAQTKASGDGKRNGRSDS
jgi:hypothetical protein